MARNRLNAGYIGTERPADRGSLSSEIAYNNAVAKKYNLDGTNIMSIRPQWHFDAAKINGVDSSGNPADGGTLGDWSPVYSKPRQGESAGTEKFLAAGASNAPVWYDGTDSLADGFNNKPYLYFDGADEIAFRNRFTSMGGWTVYVIGFAETTTSNFGGFVGFIYSERNAGNYFDFGASGPWAGRYFDTMQFYADAEAGYISAANAGKPTWLANHSIIEMIHFEQNPIGHTDGGGLLYFNGNNPCSVRTNSARKYPMHWAGFGGGNFDCKGYIFETALFANAGNVRLGDNPLTTADKNAWNAYVRTKYGFSSAADGGGIVDF